MDDEVKRTRCLSADAHSHNITDYLVHFLGCIEIAERSAFLTDKHHEVWTGEVRHHQQTSNKSFRDAEALSATKRDTWRKKCEKELGRIRLIRKTLSEDPEDRKLVQDVERSSKAWRKSPEFCQGLPKVQAWRESRGKSTNKQAQPRGDDKGPEPRKYEIEADVRVPIIQFENSLPAPGTTADEEADKACGVFGVFPDQKTTIKELLENKGQDSFLYKDKEHHGSLSRMKYIHIPANNMEASLDNLPGQVLMSRYMDWIEVRENANGATRTEENAHQWDLQKAIARYFNEERPEFHAFRRDVQTPDRNHTAAILKESHWRGQLHSEKGYTRSRFMRPFCDTVSQDATTEEDQPKNVVLFTPYLHWETSRNRQKFDNTIEKINLRHQNERKSKAAEERAQRKQVWKDLRKSCTPHGHVKRTDGNSSSSESRVTYSPLKLIASVFRPETEENEDRGSDQSTASVQPSVGTPTILMRTFTSAVTSAVQVSKHGTSPDEDQSFVKHPLGKYLMDAARLAEAMANFRDRKMLEEFLMEEAPLHPRRTLDQAYYWSLNNTRQRDLDQVVYRATTVPLSSYHRYNPDRNVWWKNDGSNDVLEDHKECMDCNKNIRKVSRVVMVDQLWMWILDERTIITSFPKRYGTNKHDASGVHRSIRTRLEEGTYPKIKSIFDLALLIFEECSNTFFDRVRTWDKQPQVLDAFSEAIGNIMHKKTVEFERLWQWTDDFAREVYRKSSDKRFTSDLNNIQLLDINPEGQLEKEIKDIVEELQIMIHINKTQRDVFKQFKAHVEHILDPSGELAATQSKSKTARQNWNAQRHSLALDYNFGSSPPSPGITPSGHATRKAHKQIPLPENGDQEKEDKIKRLENFKWFKLNADEMHARIKDRIEQLEELERNAETTVASVKDLLELKQQQAGVLQAWQALKQTEETNRQGRSIMIFTVVTIVFLPLSFMSSIFGMNAAEFSDGNYWSVKTQLRYMFSISVGVVALTLLFSLSGFSRAAIYYLYKRGITVFAVRTGMYRKSLDHPEITSEKLFARAIGVTEKLKKGEADARRKAKRDQRAAEEKKDKQTVARGEGSSGMTTTREDQATVRKPMFPRPPLRRSLPHHMRSMNAQNDVELGGIGR